MDSESTGGPKRCIPCSEVTKEHALSSEMVLARKSKLPLWELTDQGWLRRCFVAKNFAAAMTFVNAVGEIAERESHHPNFHITDYRTVCLEIFTHSIGCLTENDFVLAELIDAVPVTYSPKWLKEHPEAAKQIEEEQ
mmetsp:Transcript_72514/g.114483  ORF Transcript_72514/g.114483 Transcript_72514/m.114483 type:complete len:137 (+) Transcript_72514:19-429(+)